MKNVVFATAMIASLAACAPMPRSNPLSRAQADGLAIGAIEVVTTGAAFESARAGDYASALDPDLTAALEREFADRRAPNGANLLVDIARLNVADSGRTAFGWDQSKLIGQARLTTADGAVIATYPVQVTAGEAAKTRTGALIDTAIASSTNYYQDLVVTFAEDLRELIEQ
ncbi:hypothetical protein [Celeribacter arenosi]|uniref:Lipoprotein n=1 Tax=Celeribacter arenosi TaxID=792649 RepID=A0ABP7K2C9_9RHOB